MPHTSRCHARRFVSAPVTVGATVELVGGQGATQASCAQDGNPRRSSRPLVKCPGQGRRTANGRSQRHVHEAVFSASPSQITHRFRAWAPGTVVKAMRASDVTKSPTPRRCVSQPSACLCAMNVVGVQQGDQDVHIQQGSQSVAGLLSQPIDQRVRDDSASSGKRTKTELCFELLPRVGWIWRLRRRQRRAQQAGNEGAQGLRLAPREFLHGNKHVFIDVELGAHDGSLSRSFDA